VYFVNEKFQIRNFTEIRAVVIALFHVDRQTDDVTRAVVAFGKFFAKEPKKDQHLEILAMT
jgi:xanthine dehydrogenase iron-sulfur cluster and FAD-binding subunit A